MIDYYKQEFLDYLANKVKLKEPKGLYEPIEYILQLGGKKIRPVLVLLATDLFGGEYKKAMDAAIAVEVFHNFTLIHDDIMDDAPLRRGQATVHEKWNVNTGILSGDAMLILAYQYMESYDSESFKKLTALFSKTAIEVCEGQQYDIDFEERTDVSVDNYIEMVTLKTSVLIGCALKMGAIIAKASESEAQKMYDFGLNLGVAFQLQDDYLDAFGNPDTFGKQVGGDIIENKKTYLYIKALEKANTSSKARLRELFSVKKMDSTEKIEEVKAIFKASQSDILLKAAIDSYAERAFSILETIHLPKANKEKLKIFGENLMNRTY